MSLGTSRRERPAKPALTRPGILDAALAVLESDGFDKLTMRRLAADLDTGPASLYVYVRNTTELHALLIDRLLAPLPLGDEGGTDWRGRVRWLLNAYIEVLLQHPGLARSALLVWPDGQHYLDLVERLLVLMTDGGVSASRAAWGVDVLLQLATAMAAEYGSRGERGEQDLGDLASALAAAGPRRHPLLVGLGPAQLLGGDRDARRNWMLDALITGVADTPHPDEAG